MARLVAICPPGSVIPASALSESFRPEHNAKAEGDDVRIPPMSLEEAEKHLIRSVLESTGGNRTHAAEILGITREGLRNKMNRLQIDTGSPAQ